MPRTSYDLKSDPIVAASTDSAIASHSFAVVTLAGQVAVSTERSTAPVELGRLCAPPRPVKTRRAACDSITRNPESLTVERLPTPLCAVRNVRLTGALRSCGCDFF